MKKHIINIVAVLAVIAGLAFSVTAKWWVVWFICFPVIFAGVIALLKVNTNYIEEV